MARLKHATIHEVVSWNGDASHWNLAFVRNLNDWEEDSFCELLAILAGKEVLSQEKDEIVWPFNSKGSFSIKSFCSTHSDVLGGYDFAAKSIWKSKAPTKVSFFAWAASIGRIPTDDMLKRRNFRGPSRCSLCLEEEETADHLLVHCRWASALWDLALSLMGVSWVQPSNVRDVVVAWKRRMQKSWVLEVWNMVPLSIWWTTWKERNRRIFDDIAGSFQEFKLYFLRLLYSWSAGLCGNRSVNFLAFVDCIMDESIRA